MTTVKGNHSEKAQCIYSSDEVLKMKLQKGFMFQNIEKHNRSPKWVIVPLTGSFANIRGL